MSQLGLTFSSGFIKALLDAAEVVPQEIDALLLQAGIPPDAPRQPGARVTEEQVSALYRLLAVRFDDELPRLLSHPLRGGAMKFTGLSIVSTPTLGAALYRYSRFLRLIIHDFEIVHIHESELSAVTVREPASGRRCKTMAIEILLKVIHGFTSWLVARELQLLRIDFAFPPPSYAADLQNLFPGPLYFDQPCSRMVFEPTQMNLRVQRNTDDLKKYLGRLPGNWMCVPFHERLTSHQVRDYLLGQDLGKIQVAQMAQALHLSVRTLYRRLEAEHTSFQQVKDEVRRDVAIDRLTNGREPVSQIAIDLGFGDTSSFHRAFRAWTGMTPNAYRQHGAAEE